MDDDFDIEDAEYDIRDVKLTVMMQLSAIPDMELVCKATGSKEYLVRRSVNFYPDKGCTPGETKRTITANDGTIFLVSGDGNISVYSEDTVVKWSTTYYRLSQVLHHLYGPTPQ